MNSIGVERFRLNPSQDCNDLWDARSLHAV